MDIAFCVGNGPSRKRVPTANLYKHGTVSACNDTFRLFTVNNLFIADHVTLVRILSSTPLEGINVWTKSINQVTDPRVKYVDSDMYPVKHRWDRITQWSSGALSIWHAANHYDLVILLGYDLYAEDHRGDANAYQLSQAFKHHPQTQFVQINEHDWIKPPEWSNIQNLSYDSFKTLENMFDLS